MIPATIVPMQREVYRAGRFAVYFFKGLAGHHHVVRYPEAMERAKANYRSMIVKGGMRQVHAPDGVPLALDYVVGMTTESLPDVTVPGLYIRECLEETLMICISRNGRGFTYSDENQKAATLINVPQNGIFVLGSGTVLLDGIIYSTPTAFHASTRPLEFFTTDNVLGMRAWV